KAAARRALMRHGIDHIVDADADSQRRELLGIQWIVGILPGIPDVGVECRRDHQPAFVVVDPSPSGGASVAFLRLTASDVARSRNLIAIAQIENRMEDRIAAVDIHHLAIREYTPHALLENLPFAVAPEVIAHEESAAKKILPHFPGLRVRQL